MCGIFGMVMHDADEARLKGNLGRVHVGLAAQTHRGPDAQGVHVASGNGATAALGVARLRVIDATQASDQPMSNETGEVWTAFNGEIFNFRELRAELQRAGHAFRSDGDTEVLAHLYEDTQGDVPLMLSRLRGMFAIAMFDSVRGRLVLARDRLGIKPLYTCRLGTGLAYASEARSLTRAGFVDGAYSPRGISSWLTRGVATARTTVFEGVDELPPGYAMEWESGQCQARCWWSPRSTPDADLGNAEDAVHLTRGVLQDSVARHLVADRPVGLFLSGGLDSQCLLALGTQAGGRMRTITVTFPDHLEADEGAAAARAAEAWGADHRQVPIESTDVVSLVHDALQAMDQPSWDAMNSLLVARAAAADGLVVCLSGIGGDELFGGYPSFTLVQRVQSLGAAARVVPARARRRATLIAARWTPGGRAVRALSAHAGAAGAYAAVRGLFSDVELANILPRDWISSPAEVVPMRDGSFAEHVGVLEMSQYLPDQLLRDTDAMSMAHSLEVRVPLLDDMVVRAMLTVPGSVRFAQGKALLARAAGLPPQRRKRTFALPMDAWMRGPLRDTVRDALLSNELPLARELSYAWRRRLWDSFDLRRTHWSRAWAVSILRLWPGANGLQW